MDSGDASIVVPMGTHPWKQVKPLCSGVVYPDSVIKMANLVSCCSKDGYRQGAVMQAAIYTARQLLVG